MFIGAWVILLSHGMVQAEVPIARIYDEYRSQLPPLEFIVERDEIAPSTEDPTIMLRHVEDIALGVHGYVTSCPQDVTGLPTQEAHLAWFPIAQLESREVTAGTLC